ncbi:MAG: amidohydrolase [Ignavibacteria bacterium]|jgi:N-acetyldiaminopimelate deacetylase|nr:amidohydrolase [Ignavibacteria bacterium]MCU7503887.1 amidohydrolase [Ignavibacteria bacterium]MCU7515892.1 amidohydrolase [Ignavibacteria bacterium]
MLTPIEMRHTLHQNPELLFHEFETTNILKRNLEELDGLVIHRPMETGLVIEYTVNGGDYLLFRADIDALPIKEETGVEFSSKNNNMHACGHDVHASILYGFIRHVAQIKPQRNMVFLFQPGEEGGGGARKVIESGILESFDIKKAFALHVTDEYPLGTVASTSGVLFASAYELDISIHGKSAHVAFPENGIHSFDAFRMFLDEIQQELRHSDEKIIFGYGKVISGTARNIIPSVTRAECTIRALNSRKNEQFFDKIVSKLEYVKKKTGIEYSIENGSLYKEVIVDEELFRKLSEKLSKNHKFVDCGYKMTGEDFGFFSQLYPSFMFWLGTLRDNKYGLHTPMFLPDDSVIKTGIDILTDILQEV